MKPQRKRDRAILKSYMREISLKERKVESKKKYSRKEKHKRRWNDSE